MLALRFMTVPPHVGMLTYCPLPYNGRGPAQTCVSLLEGAAESGASVTLLLPRITPRAIQNLPHDVLKGVTVRQAVPPLLRSIPWRFASIFAQNLLDREYCRMLDKTDPTKTIAYFWPQPALDVIQHARKLGIVTVREMINCYRGTAKKILDDAYADLGLPPTHGISSESVDLERKELQLYDYISAPSECVESSLRDADIDQDKIIPTSFGWLPSKYRFDTSKRKLIRSQPYSWALYASEKGFLIC